MKNKILLWLLAWSGIMQAQTVDWQKALNNHFQRLDSIQQKLETDLEQSFAQMAKDSALQKIRMEQAVDKYADDWDYYFYLEMQRFKKELGLYGTAVPGTEEEENQVVKLIKIIRDISREIEKSEPPQKPRTEKQPTPSPGEKNETQQPAVPAESAKRKPRAHTHTDLRFEWGVNNFFGHPSEAWYHTGHSRYVALGLETEIPLGRTDAMNFLIGTGFRWHKLMPVDQQLYHVMDNRTVRLENYPRPLTYSKLRTSWLYGNLGLQWRPAKHFSVGAEIYGRFNLGSTQKLRYIEDGFEYKIKEQRYFGQTRFNYGWGIFAGFKNWQIYVGHDLLPFFENHPGQQMFTVGLICH